MKNLLKKKNVCAVGKGLKYINNKPTKQKCIIVFVEKKEDISNLKKEDIIPKRIGLFRHKTDVIETGKLEILSHKFSKRPALGGMSCANDKVSACTLGCLVWKDNIPYILGNEHCYLPFNKGAKKGDPIISPSRIDGGNIKEHTIATAYEAVKINPNKDNLVDGALAKIINPKDVSKEILGIGTINPKIANIKAGEIIKKSGRTTGVTQGRVLATGVIAKVWFNWKGKRIVIHWKDQIITEPIVDGGDSSSIGLNVANQPVGLCYAGSSRVSIFNRIQNVQKALGFTFHPPKEVEPVIEPIEGWVAGKFLEFKDNIRVSVRRLNIRKEPMGKRIATLKKGQRVEIVNNMSNGVLRNGFHWWKVLTKV